MCRYCSNKKQKLKNDDDRIINWILGFNRLDSSKILLTDILQYFLSISSKYRSKQYDYKTKTPDYSEFGNINIKKYINI